ncbi:MAG: 50S ribosomal protein L19 [Candidatus Kerfeldbacteria bacterium CG08_land_8_20_14_0_20_40_16]|uniref:50S ribosomal protein L19 n=1 Tax=Candidatus Kerfeldbacteria bacterium CG08_land_8_20_14_0_20_40_16 TaxID=2014244 RepID=A0A2H0YUF8_9BACT|nr:MAG: 50S ribosomal protein L19 [Candidatus Kerfeldbacteria bacterium CG08_land_8_20_14_0_20_40_16]
MTEEKSKKKNKDIIENIPDLKPGNVVQVYQKIAQGDKFRIQMFEGVVIAKKGKTENDRTITVRKVSEGGYGVERIFPLASPLISKITVLKKPKVRRAKLYYLRHSPRELKELKEK